MERNSKSILLIIISMILVLGVGTYAWLSYRSNDTAMVLTIGEVDSLRITLKPYQINATISPTDSYENVTYTSVEAVNNNSSVSGMNLYYLVNSIDTELVNSSFKYTITKSIDGGSTYEFLKGGDFTNIISDKLVILEENIPANTTYMYRVYTWLENEEENQSQVQGAKFDGELRAEIIKIEEANPETPVLDDGLIPVILSDDATNGYKVTATSVNDSNWYDYEEKKWANAVLVKEEGTKTRAENSVATTEIDPDDILAYFVWIPRYAYQIWTLEESATGNEQTIAIEWESDDASYRAGTGVGEYRTHPAFWRDNNSNNVVDSGETIAGIWVGKFETTGNATTPTVLPNTAPLTRQNVSTQFQTALKFAGGTLSNGAVNFSTTNSYGIELDLTSHMMKNSEWGAVAYLSHSEYGRCQDGNCEEIRNNNYFNSGLKTGCGAAEANGNSSSTCSNAYASGINVYPQSTTGNITGVFDMSGGAPEYVMGVFANSEGKLWSGFLTNNNSGFNGLVGTSGTEYTGGISFPIETKYYDKYQASSGTTISSLTACNGGICYGHGLSEVKKWYSDNANFVDASLPWLSRGGDDEGGAAVGLFYFGGSLGASSPNVSFRSVLSQ